MLLLPPQEGIAGSRGNLCHGDTLAPRLNQQILQGLNRLPAHAEQAWAAIESTISTAHDYADNARHREDITGFLDKCPARF